MLEIQRVSKSFGKRTALSEVSLFVAPGEIVGVVGRSGSGNTTLGRCVVGLERGDCGNMLWRGRSLLTAAVRRACRREIQMVFQDPRASLNPRWTVRQSLLEPLTNWFAGRGRAWLRGEAEALRLRVGLLPEHVERYPHELSTGQCQRVCVARPLAPQPALLVLDEPLSALDVVAQAQIVELLQGIQRESGMRYLFISHDVAVVAGLCARIVVLEAGSVVEETTPARFLTAPRHPVTRALLRDAPAPPLFS